MARLSDFTNRQIEFQRLEDISHRWMCVVNMASSLCLGLFAGGRYTSCAACQQSRIFRCFFNNIIMLVSDFCRAF